DLGNGYGHVAIAVEDLEALHASQSEKGLDVTDLKQLPGDTKPRYFFVTDPDGYKIEVIRL
ncbi:VOC family protein, partial [Aerococcus sp. L_32]